MRNKLNALKFGLLLMLVGLTVFTVSRSGKTTEYVDAGETQTVQSQPVDQTAALADLNKRIAGQETKPAAEVFKNIQILKGMPAGRLLRVMEIGYGKSLGVTCVHCHIPGEWEKDEKPTKQIARQMIQMANTINNDLLKNIKNLKGPNSIVNCTTCHRGQAKPALNLP